MHLPTCHRQKNGSLTRVTSLGKNNENWANRQGYPTRFKRQTIWEGKKMEKTDKKSYNAEQEFHIFHCLDHQWLVTRKAWCRFFFSHSEVSVCLSLSLSFSISISISLHYWRVCFLQTSTVRVFLNGKLQNNGLLGQIHSKICYWYKYIICEYNSRF